MRGGKPAAVILSIDEYRKLLERVEDTETSRRFGGEAESGCRNSFPSAMPEYSMFRELLAKLELLSLRDFAYDNGRKSPCFPLWQRGSNPPASSEKMCFGQG